MTEYTFKAAAYITVDAESEGEARRAVIRSCQEQDEDVQYGELGVYIPSYGDIVLEEVRNPEEQ